MRRVAHLMAGARTGGAELFFERLTVAQSRAGQAVLAAIRRDPARAARLGAGGIEPLQLGFGGALDLRTRPRLRAALRGFRAEVAVAWMNRAARLAPVGDWVLAGRLGGFYDLSYYRRCDHLIGNTRGIVAYLVAQGWPAARAHHLPNFSLDHGTVRRSRPDWLPVEHRLVLAMGRLHRNKAFDVLIRAMARVPDATLLIAGEGPERAALEQLARDEGVASRLRMPGWCEDTGALLASADLLVCPSRHEPLGNVVIEAFSARLPVVAAASQGPAELIRSGQDGLLVPLEDPAALAAGIRLVLEDRALACRLGTAGRARYAAEFAASAVLAQWQTSLDSMEKA